MADDERVTPVEPVGSLKVQALRTFGAETRPPRRDPGQKKRRQPETEDGLLCIVTKEKVDCKI